MRFFQRALSALVLLALGACAQVSEFTPSSQLCDFRTRTLSVNFPDLQQPVAASSPLPAAAPPRDPAMVPMRSDGSDPGARTTLEPLTLAGEVARSLDQNPNPGRNLTDRRAPAFLFLSGGSLHGAFGAGFLDEWRREAEARQGAMPQFALVTGISTGAILSSFAFTGETRNAVDGYSISRESELLKPHITPAKGGGLGLKAGVALAKEGAIADLSPLRTHLDRYLTHRILTRVADGANEGRMLWVGAVDVDTGEAVAFDLGDMATRYVNAQPLPPSPQQPMSPAARKAKDCYISAIVASSSAPIAARPVFIDNRMYIDGGARFGLFGAEINTIVDDIRRRSTPGAKVIPVSYAIINGTLELAAPKKCPKLDDKLCSDSNPTGGKEGAHDAWNFIDLALRSEDILANQVYRFSAQRAGAGAGGQPGGFNIVRIEKDGQDHPYTLTDADVAALGGVDAERGPKPCREWREIDRTLLNPVQFFPRYMRCMIDYGRARERREGWSAQGT